MNQILAVAILLSSSTALAHSSADLQRRADQLRETLGPAFTVVVEAPFVVAGDESAEQVKARAEGTVRWATTRLKRAYFKRDPKKVLTIFLFKDERSYRKHALKLLGDRPDTPFGYYSSSKEALVMNISTGGGTLVHEIVHPFMEANFEDCPSWFNEGLGSLYEQSAGKDGDIVGLTNWRLAGLQRAIKRGTVPSFKALTATTDREFYDEDPGTNYAQSRYLLYYLQERGLLRRFYQRFTRDVKTDPTGFHTLKAVLGEADMADFKARWQRWVLALRFNN